MNTADSGYFPLLPSSYLQSSSDANATQSAPVAGTSTESNTQSRFAGNKYAAAKKPQYDYWQESNERQRIHQRLKVFSITRLVATLIVLTSVYYILMVIAQTIEITCTLFPAVRL
jgi:hypothetical protein